jgi:hypothetical protein
MVCVKPPIYNEKDMEKEFSTFDVIKLLGVKRERLREWMNQGFIMPTIPASGIGSKAIFSILDIYKIAVFKILVDAGMNRRKASIWIKESPTLSSQRDADNLTYAMLFEEEGGGRWESYTEPGPWNMEQEITKYTDWDFGIMINFKRIRNQVKELLEVS